MPAGTPVFDAASWNGIAIDSTCGGHGTCKKCKVRVVEGELPVSTVDPRAFTPDELNDGWRLACRAPARGELVIEVPPLQTRPKAALVGVGRHVILRPSVQKRHLVLEEPSLEDQRSDLQRVLDALDDLEPRVELPVLRTLGKVLRESDFDVTAVVCDDLLIDRRAGRHDRRAGSRWRSTSARPRSSRTLLDLETGQPMAVESMLNRQQPFGADVISRVSATMLDEGALDALQARAQETLAQLTQEVCAEAGVDPGEVYEITICGNVTMTQLALGMDPGAAVDGAVHRHDARVPAAAARPTSACRSTRARRRSCSRRSAPTWAATSWPGMLATGLTRDKRIRLFIDVGTNSEIALGNQDGVVATAAPAGPAFEAAQIRCGMRAAEGAIEGVALAEDISLEVIGDVEPVGMCGSGLVDAVAELVRIGLLDHSGRFVDDETAAGISPTLAPRLTKIGEERVFVLSWKGEDPAASVYLTQRDIRELQFAKASIATGWKILFGEIGMEPEEVSQVLLAGSFGQYLSPAAAVRIGLVPRIALPRIVSAGNVAGEGSKIAALSLRERAEARSIVNEVRYVELSGRADFNDAFIDQLAFPG